MTSLPLVRVRRAKVPPSLRHFFGHRAAMIEKAHPKGGNGDDDRRCADEDASRGGPVSYRIL